MGADVLATEGATASATMISTWLNRDNPVPTCLGLKNLLNIVLDTRHAEIPQFLLLLLIDMWCQGISNFLQNNHHMRGSDAKILQHMLVVHYQFVCFMYLCESFCARSVFVVCFINFCFHLLYGPIYIILPLLLQYGTFWHHDMETLSKLLALCEGNLPVIDGFPSQRASNTELWCAYCCC